MHRLTLLLLLIATAACAESQSPAGPSGPVSPTLFVLSGTVYEHSPSGLQPLGGVPLEIPLSTASPVPFHTTNPDGQYRAEFEGWRGPGLRTVRVVIPGYRQPCRAAITLVDGENILDVHVVRESVLSTSGIPSSMPIVEPYVFGRVFERTAQGDLPVKGALVSGEFGWDLRDEPLVEVTTLTDATGHYLLCRVEAATGVSVVASGYRLARATVNLAAARAYDFALERR